MELFYDSKHSTVHKHMRKTLEWELVPFEVPARLFDG
jgi:hypothetical protein